MPDAEDDAGWGLAEVVRDRILAIYPSIQVEMWKSDGGRATDLYFTPERTTDTSVVEYLDRWSTARDRV